VQVNWKTGMLNVTGAITNGTLSNPRLSDDNNGKQWSGRVSVTPAVGLIVGGSAARGAWLARSVAPNGKPAQRSLGADIEYSRDHWIVRSETVWSRWEFPAALSPANVSRLDALATWVEGRYRLMPRLYLAARADRLGFSQLQGSVLTLPWEAPVKRLESGIGFYVQRNLILRATAQTNWREGGRVRQRTYISGQLAYGF
jgi:hypothetical protein